jgi:transcriptional regulator with XRE-family HTH domain
VAEQESAITAGLSPSETLANKIEWLIQNMWPADAPPAKNNIDTAAAIAAATGEEISSTTVWKLRTGRQDNPQLRTLTALATFFGVPIGYFGFAAEAEPIDEDLTLKALLRELRAGTISPDVLRALVDLPSDVRWVVDEMILATAAAGRRRRADAG